MESVKFYKQKNFKHKFRFTISFRYLLKAKAE